ncbi:hypothetical protein Tco_0942327 [Tanacetum coccineum]
MANVTSFGKTLEGPSTLLVPTPDVSNSQKEPEQNPKTSTEKVQNPNLENTAHVPPLEEEESIFMEIPKPKAKKTVNCAFCSMILKVTNEGNYVKSRALIDLLSIKATWLWKKAQGKEDFTLGSLREVAQAVKSRMTAWQSLSVHT